MFQDPSKFAAVAVAPVAAAAATAAAPEAKKEEKKEESESEDDDMGFGLFDWDEIHFERNLFVVLLSQTVK